MIVNTTTPKYAVYVRRTGKPRRWRLHDVYDTHDQAMSAAVALKAAAVWVTTIEPTPDTSTELTPAAAKRRGATRPARPPAADRETLVARLNAATAAKGE
jgi:hypothetical protein